MPTFRSCVPSIISQRGCVRGGLTGQNRIKSYTCSFLNITEIRTSVWTTGRRDLSCLQRPIASPLWCPIPANNRLETALHHEACMKALKGRDGHIRAFSNFLACRWKFGYKPSHPSQLKEASIAHLGPVPFQNIERVIADPS